MKLDVTALRALEPCVVCLGSQSAIIQAMLDFDFLQGRQQPSVVAIVAVGRKNERYFFGTSEVLIPVYESLAAMAQDRRSSVNLFANFSSGRRVLSSTIEALEMLPELVGGTVFAERIPERHALDLYDLAHARNIWVAGGASVGVMVAGQLKLGAIGGIQPAQFVKSRILQQGSVAVVSSSGGMVNEIIHACALAGPGVSFALAVGGERFPMTTPREVFLAAQNDPNTKAIVYFGELGGTDEYEIVELLDQGLVTKPVIAYVAGVVADLFETPPQFGHAKAMAGSQRETATAKRAALQAAGATVLSSFGDLEKVLGGLKLPDLPAAEQETRLIKLDTRMPGLITSALSYDIDGDVHVLGADLLDLAREHSFAFIVVSMLLGKPITSTQTEQFVDFALRLLVDHGPYVSGAMNSIVTARAGKDLVSSLAAGLLTIGPRFGGAINEAADTWLKGVVGNYRPADLVEEFAGSGRYISGIGHRKYRSDFPDPRVSEILTLNASLKRRRFTNFALGVEAETLRKKGNLILNVDGAIAAGLLDVLAEAEGYSDADLQRLVQDEFFNALFVLSRSVGLMGHYFDQKRLDEGLFRLDEGHVTKA